MKQKIVPGQGGNEREMAIAILLSLAFGLLCAAIRYAEQIDTFIDGILKPLTQKP